MPIRDGVRHSRDCVAEFLRTLLSANYQRGDGDRRTPLERSTPKVLPTGLATGERDELNLSRKCVRGREIAVALNENATDNSHGIIRRGNLCHSPLHGSRPAGAADEEVGGIGSRGASADVGEINVFRRISELHAVIASCHVWNVQNQRPFS